MLLKSQWLIQLRASLNIHFNCNGFDDTYYKLYNYSSPISSQSNCWDIDCMLQALLSSFSNNKFWMGKNYHLSQLPAADPPSFQYAVFVTLVDLIIKINYFLAIIIILIDSLCLLRSGNFRADESNCFSLLCMREQGITICYKILIKIQNATICM